MNQSDLYAAFRKPGLGNPRNPDPKIFLVSDQLHERRTLVTGAGIGIGRGVGIECAREGAKVVFHYYPTKKERALVKSTIEVISKAGGSVLAIPADLRNEDEIQKVVIEAEKFLGGSIQLLVNNAGITSNTSFEKISAKELDTLLGVNIRASFLLSQRVLGGMKKEKFGHIFNFSSLHASFAMADHTHYAMTKGAVINLTRNLALECSTYGVRVNAIVPGWCVGENHLEVLGPTFNFKKAATTIPTGYIATPYNLGRLVVMHTLPDFDYLCGKVIEFDGGMGEVFPGHIFNKPQKVKWGRSYVKG